MYFKQFLDELCGCASYLVASRQSREAAIIDPALGIDQYETLLADRGFSLRYVIDTHVHADHVSGARALAARWQVPVALHESAAVAYPFRGLRDGEELPLGQLRLRVVHTPGHRPELISLLVTNPPRGPEPSMVLTGDSLLVGDVGRPDFGGGDAAAQYESMRRLLGLPDWVAVFPGHFEGPCGKGMCGRPSTTVGFERRYNPVVQLDRDRFLREMTESTPARPLNMTTIEAGNRGLIDAAWAMLRTASPVDEVAADALDHRPAAALVLDVREPSEYAAGHIAGSLSLPQADLAARLDELPRDRPIYVICHSGSRSLRAAQFLKQVGYGQVVNVRGGIKAWREAGRRLAQAAPVGDAPRVVDTEWTHAGGRLT
ncbi:MAG: MBL fold metallo-hydrolase [Armatimonadota bacterium]|nr:MBL fold metallo-hydrolase [Armatimonadota bacterium]MDR7422642.1 MBL fold metallo-hydrolase [Armatimonadota bacterium]MDR7453391.1 MBL fold metallo-hydrolase [Armatimonadota bacterium]MDR7496049.1 MBL fold metallo-hydrolase [Armatimonadota bacterium]MDR7512638.1 MBL fold metallo-hydrolase [Armatimonadota bacterium]